LPAWDWLKLLWIKGKSGAIAPRSATGSAGQVKKDGSTTLTWVGTPSAPNSTRWTMVPRQPSAVPIPDARGGSPGRSQGVLC
jgi:hypothetical protein